MTPRWKASPAANPTFSTAPLIGRFDLSPTLSMPLQLARAGRFGRSSPSGTPSYTQQLAVLANGVRQAISDAINRKSLEASLEIRPPALSRVFDREFLGRKWKHVIEPRVVYNYVTGVNNFAEHSSLR